MKTYQATLAAGYGSLSKLWENRWARITVKILMIAAFSAAAALAKKAHLSLGIPGSSGIYWLTAMVIGRSVTRWDGAATVTGFGVAAWGIPVGLEHAFGYNIALYGCAGLLLDLMCRVPKIDIRKLPGALLCGFTAHMAKFGFITAAALTSGVTKHFLVVGLLNSAALHAAFGIGAGLIAWSLTRGSRSLLETLDKRLKK